MGRIRDDLFVARETGSAMVDGVLEDFRAGVTIVDAGHKILVGREMFFQPLEVHFPVEDSRARPPAGKTSAEKPSSGEMRIPVEEERIPTTRLSGKGASS